MMLNSDNERVDPLLEEVDPETSQSMRIRADEQVFYFDHHLHGLCKANLLNKPCNFRHGPRLNSDELRYLKRFCRGIICEEMKTFTAANNSFSPVIPNRSNSP